MAFGKVILLGEHAVVYGEPALAGALARGVTATAAPRDGGPSSLSVPAWDARVTTDDATPLATALADLVGAVAGNDRAFDVVADAELPPGAGLGSSAALAVAVTRALARTIRSELSDGEVERIANTAERRFHTNPSGIDVALAARGGLGVFRRGHGLTLMHTPPLRMVIGLSGEPRTTAAMVRKVATAVEANASNRRRLQSLGESATAGAEAVQSGDLARLGRLLDTAHELLAPLGVSTASLDLLVNTARTAGALGAKLTGAGGGGAVVALAPDHEDAVIEAWRLAGFDAFACDVGVAA